MAQVVATAVHGRLVVPSLGGLVYGDLSVLLATIHAVAVVQASEGEAACVARVRRGRPGRGHGAGAAEGVVLIGGASSGRRPHLHGHDRHENRDR